MKAKEVEWKFPTQNLWAFITIAFVASAVVLYKKGQTSKLFWWLFGIGAFVLLAMDWFHLTSGGGDMFGRRYSSYWDNLKLYVKYFGKDKATYDADVAKNKAQTLAEEQLKNRPSLQKMRDELIAYYNDVNNPKPVEDYQDALNNFDSRHAIVVDSNGKITSNNLVF